MIVFKLSMPNRGSWNGAWSGDGSSHIITKRDTEKLKALIGETFTYRWDDGWTALIKVLHFNATDKEYKQLIKSNRGFNGYEWMVDNIIRHGAIVPPSEKGE